MAGTPPPNYTVGNVHVSAPLSRFSLGYHPTGFIAEQVAPVMPVSHENDLYYKWDKGQVNRNDRADGYGTLRADKARAKTVNFGATTASYLAQEFAAATELSDREKANQDEVLQLELSKTRRAQDLVLLDYEIRIAQLLRTTANYASSHYTTLSGANQWNNASFASSTNGQHSVIEQEILVGKNVIRQDTLGLIPNTIVVPFAVAMVMQNDVGLIDLIKYTKSDLLVEGILPPVLWGMKVLIPTATNNATNEGEAYSGTDVWGKDVWIGYVNANPGIDSLTASLTFRSRPWAVKTWREEWRDTTVYQAGMVQAEVLVSADCGYIIKAAIA